MNNWIQLPVDPEDAKYISDAFSVSLLSGQIFSLYPEFKSLNYSSQWLYPKLNELPVSFSCLPDLDKLLKCITEVDCIGIISDYDADGILSFIMWKQYLEHIGKKIIYYIPERIEGYGPNNEAIQFLLNNNADLILALDCGTHYNWDKLKIKVCIIDHHLTNEIPKCVAFINPYRPDFNSPYIDYYLNICTTGLSFIVLKFFDKHLKLKYASKLIDLAAVGTIADMMPLTKYNRALVSAGIYKLNTAPNVALTLLIKQTYKGISSLDVGYFLAPKINSAGRLNNAKCVIQVMQGAHEFIDQLEILHAQRKELCKNIMASLENLYTYAGAIVTSSASITHGLAGIVASRIKEQYKKTSFALSIIDDYYLGSGRAIHGFNIGSWVKNQVEQGICSSGGGHIGAAGLVIPKQNYSSFLTNVAKILPSVETLYQYYYAETTLIALKLNSGEFDLLEPFGNGNPAPKFLIRNVKIISIRNFSDVFSRAEIGDLTTRLNIYAFNLNNRLKISMENYNIILEYLGKEKYKILDLWGE